MIMICDLRFFLSKWLSVVPFRLIGMFFLVFGLSHTAGFAKFPEPDSKSVATTNASLDANQVFQPVKDFELPAEYIQAVQKMKSMNKSFRARYEIEFLSKKNGEPSQSMRHKVAVKRNSDRIVAEIEDLKSSRRLVGIQLPDYSYQLISDKLSKPYRISYRGPSHIGVAKVMRLYAYFCSEYFSALNTVDLQKLSQKKEFRITRIDEGNRAGKPIKTFFFESTGGVLGAETAKGWWIVSPTEGWVPLENEITFDTGMKARNYYTYQGSYEGCALLKSYKEETHYPDGLQAQTIQFEEFTMLPTPLPEAEFSPTAYGIANYHAPNARANSTRPNFFNIGLWWLLPVCFLTLTLGFRWLAMKTRVPKTGVA